MWVSTFADSSIIYRLLTWQESAPEMPQLKSDVLEQVWYALHRIDQSIPYLIVREFRDEPIPARLPSSVNEHQKQLLLASVEIFSALKPEQLETLADNADCHSFGPGETIVRQGDQGDSLYLIVSGTLDVFKADRNTPAAAMPGQQVTSLHSTDFFGEMALCTGEARTASVICRGECVLIEIKRKHLVPLLETHPEILETMGSVIASRREELEAPERTEMAHGAVHLSPACKNCSACPPPTHELVAASEAFDPLCSGLGLAGGTAANPFSTKRQPAHL